MPQPSTGTSLRFIPRGGYFERAIDGHPPAINGCIDELELRVMSVNRRGAQGVNICDREERGVVVQACFGEVGWGWGTRG